MNTLNKIWITWETQRRSIELAKHLNCKIFIYDYSGMIRYPKSIWKTLVVLRKEKPDLLFVQNPSMILASLACCYCFLFKTRLIVDRHTTFMLTRKYSQTPSVIIFKLLHKFTIRFADLTVVTNDHLAEIVRKMGGRAFVLPDKLPCIPLSGKTMTLQGRKKILFISSFGDDEPIKEVLDAMRTTGNKDCRLYITGNYHKLEKQIRNGAPENVSFTGFLPEYDFFEMLMSSDAVMVLTTSDYCMLCGCYEAIAAEKPLITSDKKELREYFTEAVFVNNSSEGISEGLDKVLANLDHYKINIQTLKYNLIKKWDEMFDKFDKELRMMAK